MLSITLSHHMYRQADLEPIAGGTGVVSGVISSAKQRRSSAFMTGVTVVILKRFLSAFSPPVLKPAPLLHD